MKFLHATEHVTQRAPQSNVNMQDISQACKQNWCNRVEYLHENAEHENACWVQGNVSQTLKSARERERMRESAPK